MRTKPFILVWLLLTPAAFAAAAHAAAADGADAGAPLTLAAAVDRAYARAPGSATIEGLRRQAEALRRRGQAWLGGAPAVYGSYRSDRPYNDLGVVEGEVGLQLPLPNWGQRAAARGLAQAAARLPAAEAKALRLEVAGLVREALWNLRLAQNRQRFARENLDAAQQLLKSVQTRVHRGDLARADLLLAQTDLLKKQAELSQAEAATRQAQGVWHTLTGSDQVPAGARESATRIKTIGPDHPLLAAAQSRIQRETANLDYVRAEGAGNPTLSFGIRRDRPDRAQAYASSALLTLSVPFATSAYAAPGIAQAGLSRAEAQTVYDRALRGLRLKLDETRAQLASDRHQLTLARNRARIASDYLRMNRKAFLAGEIDLFTLLRIQADTQAARLDAAQRAILLRRDTARYNQALGVMP